MTVRGKGLLFPRIFFAGRALSQTGGHGDMRPVQHFEPCLGGHGGVVGQVADGPREVRKAIREELRKGANQIKIMVSGGVASPTDPLASLQYSEEEIRAAVDETTRWGTYVMAHAHTSAAIRRSVEYGVRSVEHGTLIDRDTAKVVVSVVSWLHTLGSWRDRARRRRHQVAARTQCSPLPPIVLGARASARAALARSLAHVPLAMIEPLGLLPAIGPYRGRPAIPSELVGDEWIDQLAVAGDAEDCRQAMRRLVETGIDALILCPVGGKGLVGMLDCLSPDTPDAVRT